MVEESQKPQFQMPKIVEKFLNAREYFHLITPKKQVCLHHTVSSHKGGADAVLRWWNIDPQRIATEYLVDSDGLIVRTFPKGMWANHLGLSVKNNEALNKSCIGIEIVSWGGLIEKNGNFYNADWVNGKFVAGPVLIPKEQVIELEKPHRGFKFFHKYTDAQIEAVRQLLLYLGQEYTIPLHYNEDMWDISKQALAGKSGVYSHVSYKTTKSDCYPDERLINVLKNLE